PVYFTYNTDPSKLVSFYGKIGPQISFLTKAQYSFNEGKSFDNKDAFESVFFGGMVDLGAQFRLHSNLYLSAGLNFDYDFTNAENEDHFSYVKGRANTSNMTAGVHIGLKYQL